MDEVPPASLQEMASFHIPDDWNLDTLNDVLAGCTDGTQLMQWSPDQFEAAINIAPSHNSGNHISNTNAPVIMRNTEIDEQLALPEEQPQRLVGLQRRRKDSDLSTPGLLQTPSTSRAAQEQHDLCWIFCCQLCESPA